jgi:hypothetical protein
VFQLVIKRKSDIEDFIFSFCLFAEWDGTKFFLSLADEENNGTITLMQYSGGHFTIHRTNERFCDRLEIPLEKEKLGMFIWTKRKFINRIIGSAR